MLDTLLDSLWKQVHRSLSLQCLQVTEGMKQQPNPGADISPELLIWEVLLGSEWCACHPTISQLSSLGQVSQSRGTAKTVSGKNVRAWTGHACRLHFSLVWQQSIRNCRCCGKKQGDKSCFLLLINSHLYICHGFIRRKSWNVPERRTVLNRTRLSWALLCNSHLHTQVCASFLLPTGTVRLNKAQNGFAACFLLPLPLVLTSAPALPQAKFVKSTFLV